MSAVVTVLLLIVLKREGIIFSKNGKNGHDIHKELVELRENHLHALEIIMRDMKQESTELRRELSDHAAQELVLLNKIIVLLEVHAK